jgi:PAS domain S-box-containing protein
MRLDRLLSPDRPAGQAGPVPPAPEAERRLRESQERFELLVDGVVDYAIYLLDPDGRVSTWNSGAQRLKGYTASEIIGQHFSVFYPQEALERGWPAHELGVATASGRFEDEGWRIRKDGTRFWANVVVTALRGPGGELRGFAKVTRDLTERREAHAALERRVLERTAELESANRQLSIEIEQREALEGQLREHLAKLRALNENKDQFLVTLAHELRNPLAPILSAVEVIKLARVSDPPIEHARRVIERQVLHMTRLVEDLVETSRITRNSLTLQCSDVDLVALVAEAAETGRYLLQPSVHTLDLHLSDGPLIVTGDATRLAQVLDNVLQNAIKFTPAGGRIEVSVRAEPGVAVVQITDSGIGLAPDQVPHVFDLFTQYSSRDTGWRGGLGIGLTLSRRLVEMHGGTIDLASDGPGLGTRVTIRLPSGR